MMDGGHRFEGGFWERVRPRGASDSDSPGALTPARRRNALCNQAPPPGSELWAPAGWGGAEGWDSAAGWVPGGGMKPAACVGGSEAAAGAATELGSAKVGEEC